MKKIYYVTDIAGPIVAGMKSPGAGKEILLSANQAEHPLRVGHISAEAPNKVAVAPVDAVQPLEKRDPLDHDGDGRKGGSVARKPGKSASE